MGQRIVKVILRKMNDLPRPYTMNIGLCQHQKLKKVRDRKERPREKTINGMKEIRMETKMKDRKERPREKTMNGAKEMETKMKDRKERTREKTMNGTKEMRMETKM